MTRINERFIKSLRPQPKEQFYRDEKLVGFGIRLSPNGRISFIAEGRIRGGKTKRITLGQHPALSISQAQDLAREQIALMQQGKDPKAMKAASKAKEASLSKTVDAVFTAYLKARDLKPRTSQDYKNTVNSVFADWKDKPIRSISRADCEDKFVETKDTRGLPTATKSFRIISAVFNFAMADEVEGERLITDNPADVIKQKGYSRKTKPRERFLSDREIARLVNYWHTELHWSETEPHGVTDQGINYVMLLMCSGLRKSEALRLKWEDINWSENFFVIHDTKNGTDHYVPLSGVISQILKRQQKYLKECRKNKGPWVFPARLGEGHMTEPKSQLAKICGYTGLAFRLHDLRRTFATHAEKNGASFELIGKALNHKSSSVTSSYIVSQVDTLRPVFDLVADGYHTYYDPDWKHDL